MPSKEIVTAPDGERWRVGRRWMNRSMQPRWRPRKRDGDAAQGNAGALGWLPDLPSLDGADDLLVGLAFGVVAVVAVVLFAVVIVPLLGLALEVALLILFFTSGLFGRLVLRHPWTIEAVSLDAPERRAAFGVKGWRRSRRAIAALTATIAATGPPSQLAEADALESAALDASS